MPQLAGSRKRQLQDPREPAARRHPPAAGYAAVETGSVIKVPVVPEGLGIRRALNARRASAVIWV